MTSQQLYTHLDTANKYWGNRQKVADLILQDQSAFPSLLQICYKIDDPHAKKACWTLEFVCKQKLEWLLPFLDDFIIQLPKFKDDAMVRPMAKITQMLVMAYFGKKSSLVKNQLTATHLQQLTEVSFDWLIGEQKVAVKAYSIYSLYELGKLSEWVYPELKMILEQDMHKQSAGYKAAAKNTLKKLSQSP